MIWRTVIEAVERVEMSAFKVNPWHRLGAVSPSDDAANANASRAGGSSARRTAISASGRQCPSRNDTIRRRDNLAAFGESFLQLLLA